MNHETLIFSEESWQSYPEPLDRAYRMRWAAELLNATGRGPAIVEVDTVPYPYEPTKVMVNVRCMAIAPMPPRESARMIADVEATADVLEGPLPPLGAQEFQNPQLERPSWYS